MAVAAKAAEVPNAVAKPDANITANNNTNDNNNNNANDARSNQLSRRATRVSYRMMQEDINRHRDELKDVRNQQLAKLIDRVESVYTTSNVAKMKTREQELDLKVVRELTGIGLEMSKNLNKTGMSRYTVGQVLNGLTSLFMRNRRRDEQTLAEDDPDFISEGKMKWGELSDFASKYCFEVETLDFMNGVMNTEIKERKMTQRQQRVPLGELAKPEELESTKNDHEKTTAKIMQKMVKELNKFPNSECPVVDLVFNGQSFAQFIENVFTLSFLVSQGQVSIKTEEGKPSMVKRNTKEEQEKAEKEERAAHVMALDVQGWKELCKLRKNKPGIMPHRKEATQDELMGTGKLTSPAKNKEPKRADGGAGNDAEFTIQSIVEETDDRNQSRKKKKPMSASTKKSLLDLTNSDEERALLEPPAKRNKKKATQPKRAAIVEEDEDEEE